MNHELPKPLRNALARQAGDEVHPSPDVLTSFVERTLPGDERNHVASHLAQCADCREVVFLASSVAEDVMANEVELVETATHQPPAPRAESPWRRWRFGLSWAVAALAVLLVSGVLLWDRFAPRQTASSVTSKEQPPGSAQPPASAMPPAHQTPAKTSPAEISPPRASGAVANWVVARKGSQQHPPVPGVTALPAGENAETTAAMDGKAEVAASVPAPQSAFMENGADALSQLRAPQPLVKPLMAMREVSNAQGQWRISGDGHLEHLVAEEDWTRVLANQATTFHVVSVVGGDVWAGGSGGALFHSNDGGESWSRVAIVTSSGGAATGTIASIQFHDPQHGTVITGDGSRWSTSDGGVTWISQ